MNGTLITAIEERRNRTRRLDQVRAARALLRDVRSEERRRDSGGRAWINGRRVGRGARFEHLYETYD